MWLRLQRRHCQAWPRQPSASRGKARATNSYFLHSTTPLSASYPVAVTSRPSPRHCRITHPLVIRPCSSSLLAESTVSSSTQAPAQPSSLRRAGSRGSYPSPTANTTLPAFTSRLKGYEQVTCQCQNCGNFSGHVFKRWYELPCHQLSPNFPRCANQHPPPPLSHKMLIIRANT